MATALDRMTDFDLTEQQRLVRQTVRQFAEAEILPHVEQYEREEKYPLEFDLPMVGRSTWRNSILRSRCSQKGAVPVGLGAEPVSGWGIG